MFFIGLIRCSAVHSSVLPEFIGMMQIFLVRVLNIFFKNVTILLENRGIPAAFARGRERAAQSCSRVNGD